MISSCSAAPRPLQEVVDSILQFAIAGIAMSITSFERSTQKAGPRDFRRWPRSAAEGSMGSGVALPGLELTQFQQGGLRVTVVERRQFRANASFAIAISILTQVNFYHWLRHIFIVAQHTLNENA